MTRDQRMVGSLYHNVMDFMVRSELCLDTPSRDELINQLGQCGPDDNHERVFVEAAITYLKAVEIANET